MRRTRALPLLLVLSAAVSAGAGEPRDEARAQGAALGCNRFSLDLYGRLRAKEGNLFFSPYSISSALALTREGARGETRDEIDRVFYFPNGERENDGSFKQEEYALHQEALRLGLYPAKVTEWGPEGRKEVPAYALNIANRLFGAKDATFRAEYTSLLAKRFAAPLEQLDFTKSEAARLRINGWVEEQTKERIKDLIPKGLIDSDTRLVLVNAIHFKGGWAKAFPKHATKTAPWFGPKGEGEAKLMALSSKLGYAESADAQVCEFDFRGGETSLVVILPRERDGLPALEKALSHERLQGWLGGLKRVPVQAKLPRFTFSTDSMQLRPHLEALGMKRPFAGGDFSGMSETEVLQISHVVHKAFIGVDEEGAEAAAATAVMMTRGAAPARPRDPKVFRADHPFLFLIRHKRTGAILFMGRLTQPAN